MKHSKRAIEMAEDIASAVYITLNGDDVDYVNNEEDEADLSVIIDKALGRHVDVESFDRVEKEGDGEFEEEGILDVYDDSDIEKVYEALADAGYLYGDDVDD
jgi:hypothetical protein